MLFPLTNHRGHLQRTECKCAKCVACCLEKPGMLGVDDLDIIVNRLCPIPEKERDWPKKAEFDDWRAVFITEHFQASDGALVVYRGRPTRIPTIVPRLTETGCVFLKDGLCTIHEFAPIGCGWLDVHMDLPEASRRSSMILEALFNAWRCGDETPYTWWWSFLCRHGQPVRPLQERHARLTARIDALEAAEAAGGEPCPGAQ